MNDQVLKYRLKKHRSEEYARTMPRSYCLCDHLGDGHDSQHADTGVTGTGRGPCTVDGCACARFCWMRYTVKFQAYIQKRAVRP